MKKEYKTPTIEVLMMDAGEIAIPVASDTQDPGASNAKERILFGDEDLLPDITPSFMPKIGGSNKSFPDPDE